ncbi:MAG: 4-hydroxy-3-methylbut-2-enyl diphosphate reductase [Erysipelotrichaceae bacterium]
MNVKRVVPSGFCKGVINAVNLAKKTRNDNPDTPIYILGNIVHNSYVTDELTKMGIITLDDSKCSRFDLLDQIDSGIVILTAHGTADNVKEKALEKGLTVVDGTCKDVLKTRDIIIEYLKSGYDVIYFGKKNHPEANAIISISKKIHLVSDENDIKLLDINSQKIIITNQTTMSFLELEKMIELIKRKYPYAEVIKEICQATSMRQKAILELENCQVLYVVGDVKSNNTTRLYEIARNKGIPAVYMINDVRDIKKEDVDGHSCVHITAGASTPPELINEIIDYLKNL